MDRVERINAALAKIEDKLNERTSLRKQKAQLEAKVAESTETMRTIANLFSNTVWGLLPQTIKKHFEQYRT